MPKTSRPVAASDAGAGDRATILAAVQECSGLMVLARFPDGTEAWVRPPERGLTRDEAERLIERDRVPVSGRW